MKTIISSLNEGNPEILFNRLSEEFSPNSKFGLLSKIDKVFLHSMAKIIPKDGVVVELGVYLGAASTIIAHSNSTLQIHSFDLFDNSVQWPIDLHDTLTIEALGLNQKRTIENVQKLVNEYPNIHLHKVEKLSHVEFNEPIDLYLEDANHSNPLLAFRLHMWMPRVKVGGYVVLHDYRPFLPLDAQLRFKDVEDHVDRISKDPSWDFVGSCGGFAVLQKIK